MRELPSKEDLTSIVKNLWYTDVSKSFRICQSDAIVLQTYGLVTECKHYKGPYTQSKVTLNEEGIKFLSLLISIYDIGRDDGYDSCCGGW
jgi:hypothetical protein